MNSILETIRENIKVKQGASYGTKIEFFTSLVQQQPPGRDILDITAKDSNLEAKYIKPEYIADFRDKRNIWVNVYKYVVSKMKDYPN